MTGSRLGCRYRYRAVHGKTLCLQLASTGMMAAHDHAAPQPPAAAQAVNPCDRVLIVVVAVLQVPEGGLEIGSLEVLRHN